MKNMHRKELGVSRWRKMPTAFILAAGLAIVAGLRADALTLNDGLAMYLPFNDDVSNKSTSSIAVQSAPELSAECADLVANGFVGKCLQITTNATSYGYLKLPGTDTASLAYPNNKTFSATIWLRRSIDWKSDPIVFGNNDWGGRAKGFIFAAAQGNKKHVNMHAADGTNRFDLYFDWEATEIWTFYAIVCDNGSFRAYQGQSAGANALATKSDNLPNFTLDSGYPFCIGQRPTDFSYGPKFLGAVDDFALWTRALSEEEIQRIYECGRTGMELGDLLDMDANDEPTMEVVSADNDTVTFSFGGRRTRTHSLCIFYGAADGGMDKYGWDSFADVAEIAPDATSYTYTVPDSLKAANSKYRFFLMQKDDLPYAKEVKYIQSDGSGHIDTGIAPRRWMAAEFDVHPIVQNGEWDWYFGAMGTSNKKSNFGIARHNSGLWHHEIKGENIKPCVCSLEETHHVIFETPNVNLDGAVYATGATAANFVESGWTINIFRNLKAGVAYDSAMKGWFETFTLYTPERTARNFQPAVDADGVAGMFDAVTGRFYPDDGTTLTAGDDQDAARRGWVRAVSDIYYALTDNTPATATYSGQGTVPDNSSDPANWTCLNSYGQVVENAVPTSETVVTITGETAFAIPFGTMPTCRSITFDNAILADGADCRGLDFSKVTSYSVIDLKGRTLFLADENSAVLSSFTVTDTSTGAPGTLRISVAQGATITNENVAITGNLKFRKEGNGTFFAVKAEQTYSGGTDVAAGTVTIGSSGSGHFGTGTMCLAAETALDVNGKNGSSISAESAGATLQNSATVKGVLPRVLTLTEDSTILHANPASGNNDMEIPNGCEWNLGGKTLSVIMTGNDSDLNFADPASNVNVISNGTMTITVNTTSGSTKGYLAIRHLDGRNGLRLDTGKTYLRLQSGAYVSTVMDYTSNPVSGANAINLSNKYMEIYGRFTPQCAMGFNMTMMDGSTLDLTKLTGTFSCNFTNGNKGTTGQKLSFEENAQVTVNLAGREDLKELARSESPYIITWTDEPAGVVFTPDEISAANRFRFKVETEGLRLLRNTGTVIILN